MNPRSQQRLRPQHEPARAGLEALESRRLFATSTFTSDVPVTIPAEGTGDFNGSPANPYPSTIDVSGMDGSISKVTVTLNDLSHAFPGDLDVLLVSPSGRSVMLMSDCGDEPSEGLTLTFDDDANQPLPPFGQLVSGTYKPTNVNLGDQFPPPIVSDDSWSGLLATNNGTVANGTWQLYISDDAPGDTGTMSGWSITVTSDMNAPAVDAAAFRYEQGPQELSFHLDKDVAASLTQDDFEVQNLDTGQDVPSSDFQYDYDVRSNTAMLTVLDPSGALPDGNYRAIIHTANVHDDAGIGMDGDGDGISGGDYAMDFFFLAGDANHDRTVDTIDFNAVAANFGQTKVQYPDGDFNYDGQVDTLDFNILAGQFGKQLDPPPGNTPPPPSAPATEPTPASQPDGATHASSPFSTGVLILTTQQSSKDAAGSVAADVLA